jgi:hypothetical protein
MHTLLPQHHPYTHLLGKHPVQPRLLWLLLLLPVAAAEVQAAAGSDATQGCIGPASGPGHTCNFCSLQAQWRDTWEWTSTHAFMVNLQLQRLNSSCQLTSHMHWELQVMNSACGAAKVFETCRQLDCAAQRVTDCMGTPSMRMARSASSTRLQQVPACKAAFSCPSTTKAGIACCQPCDCFPKDEPLCGNTEETANQYG